MQPETISLFSLICFSTTDTSTIQVSSSLFLLPEVVLYLPYILL